MTNPPANSAARWRRCPPSFLSRRAGTGGGRAVKWRHGLWVRNDGYEYPLVLIGTATALAATGPGAWSLDAALGLTPYPLWWAALALVAGLGSGLLTRLVLHTSAPAAPYATAPGSR